jgi:DNA topoisomerase-3
MKTLVIAEKPSVARDIARVLNCRTKGEGFLSGEGYIVSWAIGHLVTLYEPEDYHPALKRWRIEDLPIIPETLKLKALPKTKKQLAVLKKLMNGKDTGDLICATDSGREGELIFRYIYKFTGCKKPFRRLWISSMTDTAIKEGFARLNDGRAYDNLYASAQCRAQADWLVGMNATRAFTVRHGSLFSVGRVQTPTLAMLVNRQKEITAFVPQNYWEVKAEFVTQNRQNSYTGTYIYEVNDNRPGEAPPRPGGNTDGKYAEERAKKPSRFETKIGQKEAAEKIAADVLNQPGAVEKIQAEDKHRLPPPLFDLTELQRECNRTLGFSAQKTLSLAQALYERHKLITYPRTDSRFISHDIVPKLPPIVQSLQTGPYRDFAGYLLNLPRLPVTARIADDAKVTDHHAIIPTGTKIPAALTADERAVFDRVARNFLAAFYPAYTYRVTAVFTRAGEHLFLSKGQVPLELGWTALYQHEKNKETAALPAPRPDKPAPDGPPLPLLTEGEPVRVQNAETLAKKTQPPKAYTEATLLSAMENAGRFVDDEALREKLKESGLGTPSTRAAVIERLITVGYTERRKKDLIPTEKGMRLIEMVPPELRSPETTGKWERGLARIAQGGMDGKKFMESIERFVRYIVENVK